MRISLSKSESLEKDLSGQRWVPQGGNPEVNPELSVGVVNPRLGMCCDRGACLWGEGCPESIISKIQLQMRGRLCVCDPQKYGKLKNMHNILFWQWSHKKAGQCSLRLRTYIIFSSGVKFRTRLLCINLTYYLAVLIYIMGMKHQLHWCIMLGYNIDLFGCWYNVSWCHKVCHDKILIQCSSNVCDQEIAIYFGHAIFMHCFCFALI